MRKLESAKETISVEVPLFTYLEAIYLSFYSSRLYIDVAKRWKGTSIGYFLLLIILVSVPWSIYYCELFSKYIYNEWLYPIENLPLLTIQNGRTFVDKPMPFIVNNKAGEPTIKIDTTTDVNQLSDKNPTVSILITKHAIYFRAPINKLFQTMFSLKYSHLFTSKTEPVKYEFNPKDNEVFNGRHWVKDSGAASIKKFAALFSYPLTLGVLFGVYFVTNFILASIGRILSVVVLRFKITYIQSIRLIWVASTAPLLVLNLIQFLGYHLRGYSLYYCVLVICYFSFAVASLKSEQRVMVRR